MAVQRDGKKKAKILLSVAIFISVLILSYGLIRYDALVRHRMERIDPVLASAISRLSPDTQVPVLVSVKPEYEGVLQEYGVFRPINPYTHSKRSYPAIYSLRVSASEITKVQAKVGVESVQWNQKFSSLPAPAKLYRPDDLWDFEAFQNKGMRGNGIIVAKLDSGASPKWKYAGVYSAYRDDGMDKDGHGTETEEILRKGCPSCQVVSFKVLDENGEGSSATIISGLDKLAEVIDDEKLNVRVLYGSVSGTGSMNSIMNIYANRIAVDYGVISFYASGNEYQSSPASPGSGRYVWDVRAVEPSAGTLVIAPYSNRGGKASKLSLSDVGYWKGKEGTSYAAPRTAAKVAVFLSQSGSMSLADLNRLIAAVAEENDLGAQGFDETYGWGQLSSDNLLRSDEIGYEAELLISSPYYTAIKILWGVGGVSIVYINLWRGRKS